MPVTLFERGSGPPNDKEKFFFGLLVLTDGLSASELNSWASDILRYESSYSTGPFADMPDD